jgi:hypothetical protein
MDMLSRAMRTLLVLLCTLVHPLPQRFVSQSRSVYLPSVQGPGGSDITLVLTNSDSRPASVVAHSTQIRWSRISKRKDCTDYANPRWDGHQGRPDERALWRSLRKWVGRGAGGFSVRRGFFRSRRPI